MNYYYASDDQTHLALRDEPGLFFSGYVTEIIYVDVAELILNLPLSFIYDSLWIECLLQESEQ